MYFTVGMQGVKPHFCSNYFIAQQVRDNLVSRFHEMGLIKELEKEPRFIWNPGGSSYGNSIFEFELAGITIGCYALHWNSFKRRVSEMDSSRYDDKFLKLHGISNLCLSLAQKSQLDSQIENRKDKFDKLAREERELLSTYEVGEVS